VRAVRGGQPVVDRVDLIEFHHDRTPGREGGRMVEHDTAVPRLAYGEDKLLERNVLDDLDAGVDDRCSG
jgi:hypothetical protein